jgi:hypothetical protein
MMPLHYVRIDDCFDTHAVGAAVPCLYTTLSTLFLNACLIKLSVHVVISAWAENHPPWGSNPRPQG